MSHIKMDFGASFHESNFDPGVNSIKAPSIFRFKDLMLSFILSFQCLITLPFYIYLLSYSGPESTNATQLTFCLLINIFVSVGLIFCLYRNKLLKYKDRYVMILMLLYFIGNSELHWRSIIKENQTEGYPIIVGMYIQNIWLLIWYDHCVDQAIHLLIATVYYVVIHLRVSFPLPAFILILSTSFSLTFQLFGTKKKKSSSKKDPNVSKSLIEDVYIQLSSLFLKRKGSSFIVIDKNLQPILLSNNFFQIFNIDVASESQPLSIEEILPHITQLSCTEHLLNIIGEEDFPKCISPKNITFTKARLESSPKFKSLRTLVNKTQDGSLLSVLNLLFEYVKTFQKHNIGWENIDANDERQIRKREHGSPTQFPCIAYYKAKCLTINFSYLKAEKSDLILLEFSESNQEFGSTPSNLSMIDIASIIHELRTPLNGITFLVQQALNTENLSEEAKQCLLSPSLDCARRLWYIVNDILDFAQVLEGKLKLIFEKFELATALQQPIHIMRALAKDKGLEVILEIDPSVPPIIMTDQNRLIQVVYNLVGNAMKFTKSGYVKLKVSLGDCKGRYIDFAVEDTGYGIKAEDLSKLFQMFEKLDNWNDNKVGSGLGLCISNALAKALGKGLTVTSEYQKGSTFVFSVENLLCQKPFPSFQEVSTITHTHTVSVGSILATQENRLTNKRKSILGNREVKERRQVAKRDIKKSFEDIEEDVKSSSEEKDFYIRQNIGDRTRKSCGVTATSLEVLYFRDRELRNTPSFKNTTPQNMLKPNSKRQESNEVSPEARHSANHTVFCEFNFPSLNHAKPSSNKSKSFRHLSRGIQSSQGANQQKIQEVEGKDEEEIAIFNPPSPVIDRSHSNAPLLNNNSSLLKYAVDSSKKCSCPRILGVDDEPINIMMLKFLVKELDITGRFFNNGESLIEFLLENTKDEYCKQCKGPLLILMDCYMPKKDGLETAKDIKDLIEIGKIPKVYIIGCTADESEDMKMKVFKAGMDEFLKKPVSKKDLDLIIKRYV